MVSKVDDKPRVGNPVAPPPDCTLRIFLVSFYLGRQSHHFSSPYFNFKQVILGLWLDFCFTDFLDFNCDCDGYCDGPLSARARGFTFCARFY